MSLRASDPLLRRLERNAALACAVSATALLVAWPQRPDVAGGVLGGGLLIAVSYWAIRSSVEALVAALVPPASGARASARRAPHAAGGFVLRFAGRYALLALLAYAIIARLRLHPVGVLIGVSSVVVAASCEAFASLSGRRGGRQDPPGPSRTYPGT